MDTKSLKLLKTIHNKSIKDLLEGDSIDEAVFFSWVVFIATIFAHLSSSTSLIHVVVLAGIVLVLVSITKDSLRNRKKIK